MCPKLLRVYKQGLRLFLLHLAIRYTIMFECLAFMLYYGVPNRCEDKSRKYLQNFAREVIIELRVLSMTFVADLYLVLSWPFSGSEAPITGS